jgi:hypothetical protein
VIGLELAYEKIFHSFDFSPANIHDVNYLKDVKVSFQNYLLIGDRGYVSK